MSKPPVENATPTIGEPMETAEEMVAASNDAIASLNASSALAGAPAEVGNNITAWKTAVAALDVNNKKKASGHLIVAQAEDSEPALMRQARVRRNLVLGSIDSASNGSATAVQGFNVEVAERKPTPVASTPVNLRRMKKTIAGTASVRWNVAEGAKGYLLQHCTNLGDPTTFSAPISVNESRYHLTGQTPGTTVYLRVLACDGRIVPSGQTAYTAWLLVVIPG